MDNNQPLSDAEIQAYVAADAALTTTKPWKLEVTSRRMKLYAFLAAGITLAIHIFLAIVVAVGNTGTAVTVIDQWGYFLVGVLFATVIFIGLHRPRVRANEDGVDVRNFIGSPGPSSTASAFPKPPAWPASNSPNSNTCPCGRSSPPTVPTALPPSKNSGNSKPNTCPKTSPLLRKPRRTRD